MQMQTRTFHNQPLVSSKAVATPQQKLLSEAAWRRPTMKSGTQSIDAMENLERSRFEMFKDSQRELTIDERARPTPATGYRQLESLPPIESRHKAGLTG